jgi:hypothetical protein
MSYPINYPTPQGANVQIFNYKGLIAKGTQVWTKPQGASMVWFTLIGAGGGGGGTDGVSDFCGGGSGAVTNLMIPAFLVPDNLAIKVAVGGEGALASNGAGGDASLTAVKTFFDQDSDILFANGGGGGTIATGAGGQAMGANYFTAAGIFQSVTGQAGTTSVPSASGGTFLQGGGVAGFSTSNYGYVNGAGATQGAAGYFQMSPIIVGVSGTGSTSTGIGAGKFIGGIGCGGAGTTAAIGPTNGSNGGNGLAVVITW